MKRLIAPFAILTLIASTSCNQAVKQERVTRIDSLGVHLNYVGEVLNDVDSQMIWNRISDVDQTSAWVYDNVTDTLERKAGLTFGDFVRSKKYLTQALTRYGEVGRELRYSERQLATLRKDVENSFYSEEEFAGYFRAESRSVAKLVEATDELKTKYELSDEKYVRLKPQVKAIVDSIQSVIYANEPISR